MATIEKRQNQAGDITYRAKIRLKGYPTQSATFLRRTEAKQWVQHTESAIREGRYFKVIESRKHTLAQAIERYSQTTLLSKTGGQTAQRRHLTWWTGQIGSTVLSDITPALCVEYRDKLSQGITSKKTRRAPATINRYLTSLSHVFTIACREWHWLDDNPLRKVSKLKEPRGRVRFLSDDERKKLIQACQESSNAWLYTVVVLLLSTGARKGEIMGLTWDDVDLANSRIILHHTKNNERRALPLKGLAFKLMQRHSKVRRLDTSLLFPSRINASQSIDLRRPFETALKQADIQDFRWHDLRHSAASYLAMNGATLTEIAEVLGHKTLQMVKRYSHLSESHTANVVERMNQAIFK